MLQESIKQLWRAKTRTEATIALDGIENGLYGDCDTLSDIEFYSLESLIRAKDRQLTH